MPFNNIDNNPTLSFDTDNKKAGFRLNYLQVYNWGLYNNEVFTISPEMQSSLLIGGNASGKTTLIDALLTLFLSNPKYNLAGDAQKKHDRDISSYILGNYSEITNEKGEIVAEQLRKKDDYTLILASFYNNGLKTNITLGQFFWFRTDESKRPKRLYFLSFDKSLKIENDFFLNEITGISEFKKRLERLKIFSLGKKQITRKGLYTDKYTIYSDKFAEIFGLRNKDKALNLFNQTVSLKNIGNLNDFIRNEMLEIENIEPSIKKIKAAFDEARMFSDEIEKTEKKIELIKPIKEKGKLYKKLKTELINTQNSLDILNSFFESLKKTLLEKEKSEKESSLEKLNIEFNEKFDNETGILKQKKEEQEQINKDITAIENNTGISKIKSDISLQKTNLTPIKTKSDDYKKYASKINIKYPDAENDFSNNKLELEKLKIKIEQEIKKQSEKKDNFLKKEIAPLEAKIGEINENLTNLKQNKGSLIDNKYEVARQKICSELKINKTELPYICELIKVKDEQNEWQNSIEKLLRSFGLTLIISDKYYKQASDFIHKNTFKYTKVRFFRINESQNSQKSDNNRENLFSKIEIKPESKNIFRSWIANQISKQYNYLCCNSIKCLQHASRAITKSGLIKQNEFYHEKDDTNYINKNNYILGWDNSEKISVLEKELEQLKIKLKEKQENEKNISAIITNLEIKQKAVEKLLEISTFSEIDYQTIENKITQLETKLEKLKNNKELELLKEETEKLITKIKNLETEKTELTGQISTLKANIETDKNAIKDSENLLKTVTEDEQKEYYPLILPLITETINYSNQISGIKNTIEQNLKKKKKEISEPYKTLQKNIVDAMLSFKHEFPDEMKQEELQNDIGYLDDFITLYDKLENENLTELKEQFDEKLRKRSDRVINDFWMNLERQKTSIENKTGNKGRINELLKKRDYQENKSFLQIIPKENKDDEIKSFIKEIKSCFYPIGGKYTPEERLKKNKEIFVNIKSLLEKLEKYNLPGDRWAKKVTDVRNWFYFTASERDIKNPAIEIKAHSGTASKSGGETFKITYTILASAIADEFGLVGNQIKTNSLRFIAVDEIFNNLGVQWSKYVLKMFEEMDLQLLIVSPDSLEKANIAKDHIKNVHWTYKKTINDGKREMDNSYVVDITFDKLTLKK